jgi:hypothetical protein
MRLPLDSLQSLALRHAQREASRCVALFQQVVEQHGSVVQALVRGAPVEALEHYPQGDAIDARHGYQFFYHSHRAGSTEHGHLHLFERGTDEPAHLLAIGLDARGLPVSIFTVNHWVTGGPWRDAALTIAALQRARFDAARGHALVGRWLSSFVRLYLPVATRVVSRRDTLLRARSRGRSWAQVRRDPRIEVVSRSRIDWIADLQRLEAAR